VHQSCRPAVPVMKSAENRSSDDDAMRLWRAGYRRLQIQRVVRSVPVVVTEELGERREQMLFIMPEPGAAPVRVGGRGLEARK
jgi:hypothetical protein